MSNVRKVTQRPRRDGSVKVSWCDARVKAGARSPGTLDGYTTAIDLHLKADPGFAATRLCDLTTPRTQAFLDDAFARSASLDLVDRLRGALVTWCGDGQRRGWLVANPARACQGGQVES